jgi:hypothetical protein
VKYSTSKLTDESGIPSRFAVSVVEQPSKWIGTNTCLNGSLEEAFNHATSVFGDHHRAACWLEAALPAVHANTHRILKQNWPQLLRRSRELDQTLRRSA